MIEREFVEQKKKEFQIQEFVSETLKNAGHSHTKLQRTPLGEKVVIYTSRPGLIVGRKGQTISKLTEVLKKKFGLENPQVEIAEVSNPSLDSRIVAEKIASDLERFGSNRFKGIMHKATEEVLAAGAVGVEIRLSGKLPGARAKSWRVAGGYLRKCGDAAMSVVDTTIHAAQLKPGVIGIQVRIMPPGITMPDEIRMREEEKAVVGPVVAVDEDKAVAEVVAAVAEAAVPASAEAKADAAKEEKDKAPKKRKSPSKPKSKKSEVAGADATVKPEESVSESQSKEAEVKDEGNEGA